MVNRNRERGMCFILDQNEKKIKKKGMRKNKASHSRRDRFVLHRSSSIKSPMFYPPPPLPFSSQSTPNVKSLQAFQISTVRYLFLVF